MAVKSEKKRRLSIKVLVLGIFLFSCGYVLLIVQQFHRPGVITTTTTKIVDDYRPWTVTGTTTATTITNQSIGRYKPCLSTVVVGPRPDFIKRGTNFEHVGLWILSSSERTYRVNAAFAPTKWLNNNPLSNIFVTNNGKNVEGGEGEDPLLVLVTHNKTRDYKPVQYIHDLLTSTFTLPSSSPS